MKNNLIVSAIFAGHLAIATLPFASTALAQSSVTEHTKEPEKGPNNGRVLRDGDFAIELALFEKGMAPEFRIFATKNNQPITASQVQVNVKLTRLGNVIDDINFFSENEYLRGDMVIAEPHSFAVTINATYAGKRYQWLYDNYEGRVHITSALAKEMDIKTSVIGPKTLHDIHRAYGKLTLPPNSQRDISARFAGEIKGVHVTQGQRVKKGQRLLTIESNSNLSNYSIYAPIDGIVTKQMTGVGEQSGDSDLLTITNPDTLIANISIFESMQQHVKVGASVSLTLSKNGDEQRGKIFDTLPEFTPQQAKTYRVLVDNSKGQYHVGQFVKADITLGSFDVSLAVNKAALQAFRDFTVVYQKIGDQYEVRMLELGREAGNWVEVKSGIKAGAQYVSQNSYVIKADIEKSGASHDH